MKEHLIEFNQLAMANSEGSDNMLNRVMPKDNIGLAALIKTKEAAWENGEYSIVDRCIDRIYVLIREAKPSFFLHCSLHFIACGP